MRLTRSWADAEESRTGSRGCDVYAGGAKAGEGGRQVLARPGRRELSVLAFLLEALVSFFSFPLVSGSKTKPSKGGIRILKMRLHAQGQALDTGAQRNKSHGQDKEDTEGLDKKYAGACKKGARGGTQGLIAGQLPDFSLGSKPTSSHSSSRPPSLPPSHLSRPREQTSCWPSQLCRCAAAKRQDGKRRPRGWDESRASRSGVTTLGSWEPLNASTPQPSTPQPLNPSTPPWLVPHHASLGPRPTSIPRDRGQPRPSSPPLLIRRRLPQEPRRTSCLVVPWCPPTPRCAIPQRKHK